MYVYSCSKDSACQCTGRSCDFQVRTPLTSTLRIPLTVAGFVARARWLAGRPQCTTARRRSPSLPIQSGCPPSTYALSGTMRHWHDTHSSLLWPRSAPHTYADCFAIAPSGAFSSMVHRRRFQDDRSVLLPNCAMASRFRALGQQRPTRSRATTLPSTTQPS